MNGQPANYYEQTRIELHPFVPGDARILLDVGCGAGVFGAGLKKAREIEIWGVEPVAAAAAEASKRLDRVVTGYFEPNVGVPDRHFDVVMFNDSLEHFPAPEPALVLAVRKLKPGGVVVASIPNVRYFENVRELLLAKDWRYTDQGILDRTHLRFFTRKSAVRTFEECGYDVLSVAGINAGAWTGWKMRLLDLLFRKHMEDMRFLQHVIVARPRADAGNAGG
jgi:SAM-dependent methyltransferase